MYNSDVRHVSGVASINLTDAQNKFVDQISNTPFKFTISAAGGGYGILVNKPQAGEDASIAIEGQQQVRVGVAVQASQYCTSAASGWAVNIASTTVSKIAGKFVTNAASGMLAVVDLNPFVGPTA